MGDQKIISRRTALQSCVAAGSVLSTGIVPEVRTKKVLAKQLAAGNRIRVGVIGTGVRGKYLIGNLPEEARVEAICDCAGSRMADTVEPKNEFKKVLTNFTEGDAKHCSKHRDYRSMIDVEKLDAVVIATPDHHHAQAAMLALDAGLDVYLEKPLTVTIREGRLLADMVKKTNRIFQVGSQQRTMEMNRFACEFIRDGGLGKVTKVDFPNYPGPINNPQYPAEPIDDRLDWNLFLGPTRQRPHNRKLWVKEEFKVGGLLWRGWDLFREYSGHLMTNWGAHSIDMVQYALGMDHTGPVKIIPSEKIPESALERDWKSFWFEKTPHPAGSWEIASRFHPVKMEYADGTLLNLVPGCKSAIFYGDRGRMAISRNKFRTDPPDLVKDGPNPSVAEKWQGSGHVARPHLQNWLDCVRSREVPNAPVEIGHRTVTVCHLVNIARELRRPLRWDPVREEFPDDPQANQLLSRPRRKEFLLPKV